MHLERCVESPKVGRGPRFIIPPNEPRSESTRTAYTPAGGRSLRADADPDVERRIAELAAALVAATDEAAEGVAAPSSRSAPRQIAVRYGAPNRARRDGHAVERSASTTSTLEAVALAQLAQDGERPRRVRDRIRDRNR